MVRLVLPNGSFEDVDMINSHVGTLIAKVLTGSWREYVPAVDISVADLDAVAPTLLRSGAAALAWRRIGPSNFPTSAVTLELQQAYRLHAVHAAVQQYQIKKVIDVFRHHRIDPILVKGWSIARLYPELGLRPYGDIDLCIDPADFATAKRVLQTGDRILSNVDLHCGFETFDSPSWDSLRSRSVMVEMDGIGIRVLGPEDHLRLLCFHFLREGAWRPLWLCDIAVAIENRPANFDWDLLLRRNRRETDWLLCTFLLAHCLLDADLEGALPVRISESLPKWLVPCVRSEWEKPAMPMRHRLPVFNFATGLRENLRGLQVRWPNQVEATIGVGAPFNEIPRLPFQLAQCFLRVTKYVRQSVVKFG